MNAFGAYQGFKVDGLFDALDFTVGYSGHDWALVKNRVKFIF